MSILHDDQLAAYQRDGCVFLENLFSTEETERRERTAKEDNKLGGYATGWEVSDGQ